MSDQLLSEKEIQWHLSTHFHPMAGLCIPNCRINGYEMDLALITKAGYLSEIEIKRSMPCFSSDRHKRKWNNNTVCRFFWYCAEGDLANKILRLSDKKFGVIQLLKNTEVPGDYDLMILREPSSLKGHRQIKKSEQLNLLYTMNKHYWHDIRRLFRK